MINKEEKQCAISIIYSYLIKREMMNILITGASGFIGNHIVNELSQDNHNITACMHKTPVRNAKNIAIDFINMQSEDDWMPHLNNIDVVINCVGIIAETKKQSFDVMHHITPVALFKACEQSGVNRVIQISALGADETALVSYHKSKKQADDFLRNSQLDWFILQPSLVYGEGGESFKFFQFLSNLWLIPLMGNGKQMIQPVHINTVIQTIKQCLMTTETNQTIEVIGKQAISYKDWITSLRKKKSKPRYISIPIGLMKFISRILKPFKLKLISEDNFIMLEQNNTGDYNKLKSFLENQLENKK